MLSVLPSLSLFIPPDWRNIGSVEQSVKLLGLAQLPKTVFSLGTHPRVLQEPVLTSVYRLQRNDIPEASCLDREEGITDARTLFPSILRFDVFSLQ